MKKSIVVVVACLALLTGWSFAQRTDAASGGSVSVQDFAKMDLKEEGAIGTYKDDAGSKVTFGKKGKGAQAHLVMDYTLVEGGWCGLWCRAGGPDWSGVDLSDAKAIRLTVNCKSPVSLMVALMDKNNNQYLAHAPTTKGGSWETVSIPLASFELSPYYTPPDAVKGAPKDLSQVKTFNLQAQTAGTFSVAVKAVEAE